jgi:hypothetical protein
MATIYGTEVGIGQGSLILSICWCSSSECPRVSLRYAGDRISAKRAIFLWLHGVRGHQRAGLLHEDGYPLPDPGPAAGMVQGRDQAYPLALRHDDSQAQSGEFFGFFGVCLKSSRAHRPRTIWLVIRLTGSTGCPIPSP